MIRRDQILRAQRRQHRQLRISCSTHPHSLSNPSVEHEHPQAIFSTLLEGAHLGEPLGPPELAQLTEPAAVETLERKGLIARGVHGRRGASQRHPPSWGSCRPVIAKDVLPTPAAPVITAPCWATMAARPRSSGSPHSRKQ